MASLSLYRRCRPLTFGDMTGQEHITRTLSNALLSDRLAHAYLFCGPRGTGKTTAAKILARAMNCKQYPVSEPCGQCLPCQNIASGVSMDVIEMDAASNRGIDEIRELRERSRFASGESRFKVYIIDEAHMLTTEACNAFLKTLEEPPQNVVFILATTDPSRLPSTIVSRCQRFDFHLLNIDQIRQRLDQVLTKEGWHSDNEAVNLIARLADGSLRDALGILEQCSTYGEGQITADQVRIVTGATRLETIGALVKATVENDLDSAIAVIEQMIFSGRDLNLFLRDFTFVFTRLLLESGAGIEKSSTKLHGFEELIAVYHGKIAHALLLDAVELLHELSGELRHAHFPQYILEVAFIRLFRLLHGRLKPAAGLQPQQVELPVKDARPDRLPAASRSLKDTAVPLLSAEAVKVDTNRPEETATIAPKVSPSPSTESITALREAWPQLLQQIKKQQKTTAAWLEPAVISYCRGQLVRLTYAPEYDIHRIRIMEQSHRKLVESVLADFLHGPIELKTEIGDVEYPSNQVLGPGEPVSPRQGEDLKVEDQKKKVSNVEEAMKLFGGKLIDSE